MLQEYYTRLLISAGEHNGSIREQNYTFIKF